MFGPRLGSNAGLMMGRSRRRSTRRGEREVCAKLADDSASAKIAAVLTSLRSELILTGLSALSVMAVHVLPPSGLGRQLKIGHHEPTTDADEFYLMAPSPRKAVCTLVRQLRGPHLSLPGASSVASANSSSSTGASRS